MRSGLDEDERPSSMNVMITVITMVMATSEHLIMYPLLYTIISFSLSLSLYIYIYIHMEREREGERDREREIFVNFANPPTLGASV